MWRTLSASPERSPEYATSAADLLQTTCRNLILASGGFALAWYLGVAGFWSDEILRGSLLVMLLVVAACALALHLLPRRFLAAQAAWQLGLGAAITLALSLARRPEIALFYAFLPLIGAITLDWAGALAVELLVAALAYALDRGLLLALPVTPHWMVITAGGAFGGLLGWVMTRSLLTVAQWSLFNYTQAQRRMQEAGEQRLEFKQTQEDLTLANRELARLSDRLKVMYRVAEEARRAKEEFVANVSHELRTPLNMIIGFSEMITRSPQVYGTELSPALQADISAIQRNSEQLARLVDDVLDLSQAEAGRMTLNKEWTVLDELVDQARVAVRALYESKGLYLQTEVAPDLPPVFCDSTRIRQVLINLLSNAGRFTERGGVRVEARREGERALVSVTDTGSGIAPEDQQRLFEPFQQLDSSIRRRHGGSGLGLSISKRFVEMHGGEMWLESQVGRGATFTFALPLDTPLPAVLDENDARRWFNPYQTYEERTRRSKAPPPVLIPRFVVMEAGDTLQQFLYRYVQDVEVTAVRDIEGAIAALNESPAQALLINVPPAESTPLPIDRLAQLPYGTPAMACWVPGEDETARRLGILRYLVKPVDRETMLSALQELGEEARTVLLVDDDAEALQLFARMLASSPAGYRVLRARSGPRALHLLRARQPDVMLLDLIMPGMDGFQVLELKSQDPSIRDIPVVIVSSRDPSGEPIVSDRLNITRSGGLSVRELVTCMRQVSQILVPPAGPDPGSPGTPAA